MKLGIIQTQRLGDLIIALPIAAWFRRQGWEVYWPVFPVFYSIIQAAAPGIHFMSFEPANVSDPMESLYRQPLAILESIGCDKIIPLYSVVAGDAIIDHTLAECLKFDEYKYARAGVPFSEKWTLSIRRNPEREKALFQRLNIKRPYICVHQVASDVNVEFDLPAAWRENFQIVPITAITDNPFDWLYTIEHAAKRVMIDSSLANLVEQLNITGENYLVTRSVAAATPVYRNGWFFCWPFDPIPDRSAEYAAARLAK